MDEVFVTFRNYRGRGKCHRDLDNFGYHKNRIQSLFFIKHCIFVKLLRETQNEVWFSKSSENNLKYSKQHKHIRKTHLLAKVTKMWFRQTQRKQQSSTVFTDTFFQTPDIFFQTQSPINKTSACDFVNSFLILFCVQVS